MTLKIRSERIKRNLSCEQVAKQIGLTAEAIRLIETGKRKLSYDILLKLEDVFKMSHRELFEKII